MHPLLEKTYERRHLSSRDIADICDVDQVPLAHIDEFCEALHEIHEEGSGIVILPDYDMDGIMSGVVGLAGLETLGFNVVLYTPDPKDGYGFFARTINKLHAMHPGAKTILTCDTGITCYEGTSRAHDLGLRVLVSDHHSEAIDPTKSASDWQRRHGDVVVDPCALDETYPLRGICGAYVLWKILDRYAEKYGMVEERKAIWLLRAFAGIGTVSDIMPVVRENRALVYESLAITRAAFDRRGRDDYGENLTMGYSMGPLAMTAFRGLGEFVEFLYTIHKLHNIADLTESTYGFYMAPMFNSLKRLDVPIHHAFDAFFGATAEVRKNAREVLGKANNHRRALKPYEKRKMWSVDQPYMPYVWFSDGPKGVRGLLAQDMREMFHVPAIVVGPTIDPNGVIVYSGSGRAPDWFKTMDVCRDQWHYRFAGHNGAFGATFKDEKEIKAYVARVKNYIARERAAGRIPQDSEHVYDYYVSSIDSRADAPVNSEFLADFVDEVDRFAPWGRDNPRPRGLLSLRQCDIDWNQPKNGSLMLTGKTVEGIVLACWDVEHAWEMLQYAPIVVLGGEFQWSYYHGGPEPQLQFFAKAVYQSESMGLNFRDLAYQGLG